MELIIIDSEDPLQGFEGVPGSAVLRKMKRTRREIPQKNIEEAMPEYDSTLCRHQRELLAGYSWGAVCKQELRRWTVCPRVCLENW